MAGSIEKRGPNKFRLVVSAGLGADKRQIKKTKTVTTKHECPEKSCKGCKKIKHCRARGEAEKELALLVADVERGLHIDSAGQTFDDFSKRWLRDHVQVNLKPKTQHEYQKLLKRPLEAMGHLRLDKIRPTHLLAFYDNLREEGIRQDGKQGTLSEKTIRHYHTLLSGIFSCAVQWQILQSNPASRIKPPKVTKKTVKHYNEAQVIDLLQALEQEPLKYRAAITLTVFTGIRKGELLALGWDDVDFEEGTIRVDKALQYVKGFGTVVGEPKTEKSKRVISVPPSVISLLKTHKAQQAKERLKIGDLWQGSNRLLTTWDGRGQHPTYLPKWWRKFLKRHNLPHLHWHGLRHSAVGLLIGQDVHIKTISDRIGHSSVSTSMDIYGHFLKSADQKAAEKLEGLFNKNLGTNGQ